MLALAFVLIWSVAANSTVRAELPNLTGTWAGSISIPTKGGLEKTPLNASFKHEGIELGGAVGLNSRPQIDISRGAVESTKFGTSTTFDMPTTGFVMHFELRLAGNVLRGVARLDGEKAVAPVELQLVR